MVEVKTKENAMSSRFTSENTEEIVEFIKNLREDIISNFESLEPEKRFIRKLWNHKVGGGGEMGILRGDVFEKAAVNFSSVNTPNLFATGVSLITHMMNPHMPTVHMNIRFIKRGGKWWVGGGYDLTPMGFEKQEDTEHFHLVAKQATGKRYLVLKKWADEYFTIKHWGHQRGVGGIFFDDDKDFDMWAKVGSTFLNAIMPIYQRRQRTPYTETDRRLQAQNRAKYVEFNLLYDRGTKFGFQSGGNPEAILCSMPPTAVW